MQKKFITIEKAVSYWPVQITPQHQLCYYQWGDSDNPNVIFCVHGLTRNAREFDYLARELAKTYRIIAVDMPGRGDSEWLENKFLYNYTTYAADCLALLKALSIKQVIWCGSSMGGIIGMIIAAKENIISHLILNDIGPKICGKSLAKIAKYVGLNPEFDSLAQVYNHCQKMYAQSAISTEKQWKHLVDTSIRFEQKSKKYKLHYDPEISVVIHKERNGMDHDVHLWKTWHKIKVPICILWGNKSQLLREPVAQLIQEQDNVELYVINDVGHTPSLMDNYQIDIIRNWLQGKEI